MSAQCKKDKRFPKPVAMRGTGDRWVIPRDLAQKSRRLSRNIHIDEGKEGKLTTDRRECEKVRGRVDSWNYGLSEQDGR